jgi:hypothetical protein
VSSSAVGIQARKAERGRMATEFVELKRIILLEDARLNSLGERRM